ncbi:unnamed protein product [Scytosiphon promiscuus]
MDQPLTSSAHLGDGHREAGKSSRMAEEAGGGGGRSFSFTRIGTGGAATRGGGRATLASPTDRDSLASRYGLHAVAEIQSKDLRCMVSSATAMTLVFLILGGVWFMVSDRWTFTETVYFMCTSLMTIGYGDVVVKTSGLDRMIDTLLILLGLAILAISASCVSQPLYTVRPRKVLGRRPVLDFDVEAEIRNCSWMLAHRFLFLVVVTVLGLVVFMVGEGASFTTSFYWVIVTSSSIGYGDVVPTSRTMRWFTSFYCIVATGAMLEMLRFAGMFPFEIWRLKAEGKVFDQFAKAETASERAEARSQVERAVAQVLRLPGEERNGGAVSRSDVALSMLLLLDRVSYEDVQQAARIYDKLGLSQGNAASTTNISPAGSNKS